MGTKEKELNHRNFFKNAALAGAGLTIGSSVLSASQGTENSSKQVQNSPNSAVGKRKPGQLEVSASWLLAQKPFILPIPGTISQQHLTENLGALDVKFAPDELKEFRSEIENFKLLGVRTPESALVDQ